MKKLLWDFLNKKVWLFLVVLLGISASFMEVKGQDCVGRGNTCYFKEGRHTCAEGAHVMVLIQSFYVKMNIENIELLVSTTVRRNQDAREDIMRRIPFASNFLFLG